MIHINHLKKSYDSFTLECSLDIPKGMITGIIGMNGAGKTTLFKSILGINPIDEGNIQIPDKQEIGVVLSETGFSEFFTVSDIISILKCTYKRFDEDLFRSYCQRFDVSLDKKTRTFSTGMKAKLNIIIALTHHAQLLILDEPTAGLDVLTRDEILDILRDYTEQEDCTILISSHISSDLESLSDDLYVIDHGQIIMHEEMDTLLSQYGVLKVSKEDYDNLDKDYLLEVMKEPFGYSCLTNERQYYIENYPTIVIEQNHIDPMIPILLKGERLSTTHDLKVMGL